MAEAAEARDADATDEDGEKVETKKRKRAVAGPAKKKVVKKKSRSKPVERRRVVWVIYNSTQKEEDRFAPNRNIPDEYPRSNSESTGLVVSRYSLLCL